MNAKVLLVDDEPNVLQAYSRTLRKRYQIVTATSGQAALAIVAQDGPFAVVISDMRMPEMDGVQLLSRLKECVPDTVRIMLTGNADQQTAIDAVNKGDIFRFLNKPCPPDVVAKSIDSAIEQHRLVNAERELLENTVKGSLAALTEVLSLSKPGVFGRTTLYKRRMLDCAKYLNIATDWELETTALLSLIGTVSLPDSLVNKALSGAPLTADEACQYQGHAALGAELLAKIPRMESVAEAIRLQLKSFDGTGAPDDKIEGESIPVAARLLRVVTDYDLLERSGLDKNAALGKMERESGTYDPSILGALSELLQSGTKLEVKEIDVHQLGDNMALAKDLRTRDGRLLVCKGQQLTTSVANRLLNFYSNGAIDGKLVVVILPGDDG